MEFFAIDVETANADMSSICQIGIAKFKDNKLIDEWCSLIDPEDYFDPMNIFIHGITESDVEGAPKIEDVAQKLYGYLDNALTVCHTHFDRVSIANIVLESSLDKELRSRVSILPIGSHIAIARQMASRYKESKKYDCLAIMDGDQRSNTKAHISNFLNSLEKHIDIDAETSWFKDRLLFLPGDTWPEKWLVDKLSALNTSPLADLLKCSDYELDCCIEEALTAEKHDELYELSNELSLDFEYVKGAVANWLSNEVQSDFEELHSTIRAYLD